MTVFGGVALALAIVRLYGVVSYAVATQTREIGIRVALGADRPTLVGHVSCWSRGSAVWSRRYW